MAKVSVIVPIYNVEQYLRRCIDSLLLQSLNDIEIILVNDASPDRSLDIMRHYEHMHPDKIIIIDSKENLKQGGARNLGIKAASANYIGFVDGDDWVHKNMFEDLYKEALEKNAEMVSCNACRVNDQEEITPYLHRDLSSLVGKLDRQKRELLLLNGAAPGVVTKIYRKSLIIDQDIWFPEHLFYEDNLWMQLVYLYADNYHHLDKNYYFYYTNMNSTITTTESMHHFDRLVIEKMKLEQYKKRGLYDLYSDAIEFSFIQLYYVNSLHLAFTRYSSPPFDKVYEMRKFMKEHFPHYRQSKYFHLTSQVGQVLTALNDISPYKAYEWYKTVTS